MALRYSPRQSLAARLIAFCAWFILSGFILAGAIYASLVDFWLMAPMAGLLGLIPFFLLQSLAEMVDQKQNVRHVVMRKKSRRVPSGEKQPEAAHPQNPPAPAPAAPEKKDPDKKFLLICKCMEFLCENIPVKMPPTGKCPPLNIRFDFPGTKNEAYLCAQCDAADSSLRRLVTRIVKSGTDLCMMNYMFCGTQDELLAYLSDQTHAEPLLASLQHLSDQMDDRD